MIETDDKLIREFFVKQKQEIPDNGFSRRVMHHLPYRTGLLVKIWSVFITLVAVVLFFAYDGLQAVAGTARDIFVSMVQSGAATGIDLKSLIIAAAVLMFLGVRKAWSMA